MANGATIPDPVLRFLVGFLAVAAIFGFGVIFADGMLDVWAAEDGAVPTQSDALLYVATALAGLVGGIVAVGFGVPAPSGGGGTPDGGGSGGGGSTLLTANLAGVGSLALPAVNARAAIGGLYAVVYVVWGLAALVTWVAMPNETSDLVKNLGTTFLGLAIPIVSGYFRR